MSIRTLSSDVVAEMSMIEIAYELMEEQKKPFVYSELLQQVADIKGMSEEEVRERIANLYTELNIDGRFVSLSENRWGLKKWYPLDQIEEEMAAPIKPTKTTKAKTKKATKPTRKKAKADKSDDVAEDEIEEAFDEFEDLEDELDDIAKEDDSENGDVKK